jgi:phospholipase/carboxylesterase
MQLLGLSKPSIDPHNPMPAHFSGVPLPEAEYVVLLLHGRGATAESIEPLAHHLGLPDQTAVICPQAANNTWYPLSFMAPRNDNEPFLTSALLVIQRFIGEALEYGVTPRRIILAGFSQGACLASEASARLAQPFGGLLGFSGGVIGQEIDEALEREDSPLAEMPVFLGCSDIDLHIPEERVHKTADLLQTLGANVDCRIYPGMGHTINSDELDAASQLIKQQWGVNEDTNTNPND